MSDVWSSGRPRFLKGFNTMKSIKLAIIACAFTAASSMGANADTYTANLAAVPGQSVVGSNPPTFVVATAGLYDFSLAVTGLTGNSLGIFAGSLYQVSTSSFADTLSISVPTTSTLTTDNEVTLSAGSYTVYSALSNPLPAPFSSALSGTVTIALTAVPPQSSLPTPGPIAGAGLPSMMVALAGLVFWRRRSSAAI